MKGKEKRKTKLKKNCREKFAFCTRTCFIRLFLIMRYISPKECLQKYTTTLIFCCVIQLNVFAANGHGRAYNVPQEAKVKFASFELRMTDTVSSWR